MQYDENAEKYGYEGEMTPLKCDELKPCTYDDMIDGDADINIEYYPKSDADAIIAQKDFEIDRLKEFNAFLKQRISNGDVGCSIFLDDLEQKDKEIAELKQKLENVQASMYCDVVDANMENRRLKRALWLARAKRAFDCKEIFRLELRINELKQTYVGSGYYMVMINKWQNVERKCRAKAEEYK